jgi:transposase
VLKAAKEMITCQGKPKKENLDKQVHQPLPTGLERREEITESDPIPEGSKLTGEEITEVPEYTPGRFYVRRIGRGVVIGDLPALPLPKSPAGASLLSHLSAGKYRDHLPFYRQTAIFKRQSITLSPAMVNGWVSASVDLSEPLYETLKKETLSPDYLRIDESTIPVMDKNHPESAIKDYPGSFGPRDAETLFSLRRRFTGTTGSR